MSFSVRIAHIGQPNPFLCSTKVTPFHFEQVVFIFLCLICNIRKKNRRNKMRASIQSHSIKYLYVLMALCELTIPFRFKINGNGNGNYYNGMSIGIPSFKYVFSRWHSIEPHCQTGISCHLANNESRIRIFHAAVGNMLQIQKKVLFMGIGMSQNGVWKSCWLYLVPEV